MFLPWLSSFLYQRRHTGTPWGVPASFSAIVHAYAEWAGGPTTAGRLALVLIAALLTFAVFGTGAGRVRVLLDFGGHQPGLMLVGLATATLLVAVARGTARPQRLRRPLHGDRVRPLHHRCRLRDALPGRPLAVPRGCRSGRGGEPRHRHHERRSRTGHRPATSPRSSTRYARPGDIVLACPDQLGPAVARLAPPGVRLYGVPTLDRPGTGQLGGLRRPQRSRRRRRSRRPGVAAGRLAHVCGCVAGYDYRTYESLCPTVNFLLSQNDRTPSSMLPGEPGRLRARGPDRLLPEMTTGRRRKVLADVLAAARSDLGIALPRGSSPAPSSWRPWRSSTT